MLKKKIIYKRFNQNINLINRQQQKTMIIDELTAKLGPRIVSKEKVNKQIKSLLRAFDKNLTKEAIPTAEVRKVIQPKRYIPDKDTDLVQKNVILKSCEAEMEKLDKILAKIEPQKANQIIQDTKAIAPPLVPYEIEKKKNKPLNRHENDLLLFKEIFVQPKEDVLNNLKEKEKQFENLFYTGTLKQYDKILQIESIAKGSPKKKQSTFAESSLQKPSLNLAASYDSTDLREAMEFNSNIVVENCAKNEKNSLSLKGGKGFFNQQIQVQAPDLPNSSVASPLAPGLGWAPSIPITKLGGGKINLKDLLIRANANLQEADLQKEAHLSYYLAYVYENKKMNKKAIKFYKRYYNCAKGLEDKIGMALTMNRIGVCYHNLKNEEKSISYHLKNLELSDDENTFAAFYNLGISFRSLEKFAEAQEYFSRGLTWAEKKRDDESRCLIYGQIGITSLMQKQYQIAQEYFENCYQISKEIQNIRLELDSLLFMTQIQRAIKSGPIQDVLNLFEQAYEAAKILDDEQIASECLISIGLIKGNETFLEMLASKEKFDFQPTRKMQIATFFNINYQNYDLIQLSLIYITKVAYLIKIYRIPQRNKAKDQIQYIQFYFNKKWASTLAINLIKYQILINIITMLLKTIKKMKGI